jgi:NADPH:quinone reductase-like Zn-dependent oxidoreductase
MRAAVIRDYGSSATSLVYSKSVQKPSVRCPDDVLVKIKTVALSALDVEVRRGEWKFLTAGEATGVLLDHVPGFEYSGIVEAVGGAVQRVAVGDEVCGLCSLVERGGACAEYTVQREDSMIAKPKLVLHDDAAMAIGPGIFSLTALHYNLKVDRDSSILICDGASADGYVLVQMAAELGMRIFVTACSQEQVSFLETLGGIVARVIDECQEDLADVIMQETNRMGVDYIVETLRYVPDLERRRAAGAAQEAPPLTPSPSGKGNPFRSETIEDVGSTGNPFLQTLHRAAEEDHGGASVEKMEDSVASETIKVVDTAHSEETLARLSRKRALISSLAVHGRWVSLSKDLQLDPDESALMAMKNASLSWIFPQAWVLSPSKQGHFLHVMDSVMRNIAEGKLRPLPCSSYNLSQIRDAHRQLENTLEHVGRVIIKM